MIVGYGRTYWALVQILNAQATNAKVKNYEVYLFNPADSDLNQWEARVLEKEIKDHTA